MHVSASSQPLIITSALTCLNFSAKVVLMVIFAFTGKILTYITFILHNIPHRSGFIFLWYSNHSVRQNNILIEGTYKKIT